MVVIVVVVVVTKGFLMFCFCRKQFPPKSFFSFQTFTKKQKNEKKKTFRN
jgi:hypothetical protein